ncbi:hypothetical protein VP01_13810g1, partial [Puccinia sorghi]
QAEIILGKPFLTAASAHITYKNNGGESLAITDSRGQRFLVRGTIK